MSHTFLRSAFTLVELIVVVTILGILGTIGFVSYSGYLTEVRDTNRTTQIASISEGLNLYKTKHTLPLPDDSISVTSSGSSDSIVSYQGYAGESVLSAIDYSKQGLDPKDKTYFTYSLSKDRKHHQLLAFLEESNTDIVSYRSIFPQAHANIDYTLRYPTITGKPLGIILDETNTPVQENSSIQAAGLINLSNVGSTAYTVYYKDNDSVTATNLASTASNGSCKRIYDTQNKREDGIYIINPTGTNPFQVYCDMTTDGGGWTYATMLADTTTRNLFDTGNTNKITSLTDNVSTKGQLSDIWTDDEDKDIAISCLSTSSTHDNFAIPTIIYDYKKSDINHLEKQAKAGTTFASDYLAASWNGNRFTLDIDYRPSGTDTSFYPRERSTLEPVMHIYQSVNLEMTNVCYAPSACYAPSQTAIPLSGNHYCFTAIR